MPVIRIELALRDLLRQLLQLLSSVQQLTLQVVPAFALAQDGERCLLHSPDTAGLVDDPAGQGVNRHGLRRLP
jgi:hypothetical protein